MVTFLLFILMMLVLIIPHEFGHFIIAKMCGVQVNEFSIGMGPRIFHKKKGETEYSVRLLPIGGFCAMEGEDEESDNPRAFNRKKPSEKIAVLLAGSMMNVLLAIVLMTIVMMMTGVPGRSIDTVINDSPAAVAGIKEGDKIISVQGRPVDLWTDFTEEVINYQDDGKIEIGIERDGKESSVFLLPEYNEEAKRYIIGVTSKSTRNPLICMSYGLDQTIYLNGLILKSLVMLVTGEASFNDVSGPVGMVKLVSDAKSSGVTSVLSIFAVISLNLALFNLLPLPALDGGRIFFVILRLITRDKVSDKMEGLVHAAGMILLLGLMIIVTFNDIFKLL